MDTSIAGTLLERFYESWPTKEQVDMRTQNWLLVDSPWRIAGLVGLYFLMVHYLPMWMSNRKPFQLKDTLVVYNLAMLLLNAHIFKEAATSAYQLGYNFWCQPIRVVNSALEMKIAKATWWFFFSKLLEFMDTLFFILRKKNEQLSFLHIYHHSTMFPLQWLVVKWVPTGSSFVPCMLNSFVHIVMYSYYGLSSLGPKIRKYLWWKRYLTMLQLIQFTFAIMYSSQAILSGCEFPIWTHITTLFYMITFLYLFGNFYKKTYVKKNCLKDS